MRLAIVVHVVYSKKLGRSLATTSALASVLFQYALAELPTANVVFLLVLGVIGFVVGASLLSKGPVTSGGRCLDAGFAVGMNSARMSSVGIELRIGLR
jgi:hypothetical protein